MNKINFQNLPSTSTPVNAANLNQVQTNVENVFKVLGEGLLSSANDIADCNDTSLATGVYYAAGSTSNTPFSSAWFIVNIKRDTTNITQFAIRYMNNQVYERHYNTQSPSGWKAWQIATSGKNILTAVLGGNGQTISTTGAYEKLLLSLANSVGSKLSVSNNAVVIGAGVTKVIVSYIVLNDGNTNGRKYATLYKNGTAEITTVNYASDNNVTQIVQTPTIISVAANDVLDLRVYGTSGDNIYAYRTYMTVECID